MKYRNLMAVASTALALSLWCDAASADVIVIKAQPSVTVGGQQAVKPGDILLDRQVLNVPAGAALEVLLPSGALKTVNGRYSGPVADLMKDTRPEPGLWGKLVDFAREGGLSERPVGATRSAPARETAAFSWRDVALGGKGDVCVEGGAPLFIVRANARADETLTVVDLVTTSRATVSFGAGVNRAAWPAQVPPKTGKFALTSANRDATQVQLRMIAPLPTRETTMQVLNSQNCLEQAKMFLQSLVAAGRTAAAR